MVLDSISGVIIMYENAQYYNGMNNEHVGIRVDINGVTSNVPLDPANSDYAAIMQLVAEGKLTIGAAE
jgi:hypothetical protein